MSEIKTDKLTGVGTAGSIVVTGEGNSTTTNLQQGLCKVFCAHNSSTSILNSLNISSLTDEGTGDTTHNFTNSFSGQYNHSPNSFSIPGTDVAERPRGATTAVGSQRVRNEEADTNTARDADTLWFTDHGDLA